MPVETRPSFCVLHHYAFPMSILEAQSSFSPLFLFDKFLSLRAKDRNIYFKHEHKVLVPTCLPFVFWKCFLFRVSLYYPGKNIKTSIINNLTNNRYVYLCINEQYIPNRTAYKKFYRYHEILVYGYDDKNDIFKTIAYNQEKKYAPQDIPSELLVKAYKTNHLYPFTYFTLKLKLQYNFDKLHLTRLKRVLHEYLYTKRKKRGYHAYAQLIRQIQDDYQTKKKFDIRSFRTIKDRATILSYLPKYFSGYDDQLIKIIENNVDLSNHLLLLTVRFYITREPDWISDILNGIKKYVQQEKEIIYKTLMILKNLN